MVRPALVRDRRREQHARGEVGDVFDELSRAALGQMLGDLERNRKVEPTIDPQWLVEPRGDEALGRKMQLLEWHPVSVDAQVVLDAVAGKGLKPDAVTAAEIDYAARLDALDHDRHVRFCARTRAVKLAG